MPDTTPVSTDTQRKRPITNLTLNYTCNEPHDPYFVVTIHRGNWNKENSTCCHYWRVSRASLLRVNRAQRLLIRCVTADQIGPAAPLAPESNIELAQLTVRELEDAARGVRMCADPECIDAALPEHIYCAAHLPVWSAEDMLRHAG